ncbi:MAG: c-type cytochrome biogenesis protein CcsB [Propionibacteriales bacterium]|nr:c-type cytochrome biogenesis protein CcsB [Propionibacteriales bacterium]
MYSATIVYALAMLAHMAEWATAHNLPADDETNARRSRLVRATAGVAASGARAQDPPRGIAAQADSAAAPDVVERSDRYGRIGVSLTVLGLLLHAGGVLARGTAAERVPWGSMYEFSITATLAVAAAYVLMVRRAQVRWLGLLVTGFLVTVLGIAMLVLYRPVGPLVPALHSYWLAIHVSAAAIAGGAFTVGALASVLYLLRSRLEATTLADLDKPRTGYLWRAPSAADIDRVAYRVHAFAFPLWTFAVLAGAIWAEYAWGRFWGWDPKEVWALITWIVYAAYLHARATAGWQGRAAAYVALFGYATFLFNFVGINLFGSGLHSYAGM